jgi:hypothetical protein
VRRLQEDPERLGKSDKIALLPPTARRQAQHLRGLLLLRMGRRGRSISPMPPTPALEPPATDWARAAVAESEPLSCGFWRHSMRAWYFATALSQADGKHVDHELLFVVAVLHDLGLFLPMPDRCFTVAGAEAVKRTAIAAGVPGDRAQLAADAVFRHISVRKPAEDTARYLQAGSLLDIAGTRVWDLDPRVVALACRQWSRQGFPGEVTVKWHEECRRFPEGRANYARRPGCLLVPLLHAPLPGDC